MPRSIVGLEYRHYRDHIQTIFERALIAVEPSRLVCDALSLDETHLSVGETIIRLDQDSNFFLVAAGKASARMTQAALDMPGLSFKAGVITMPAGRQVTFPSHLRVFSAGHPIPNTASLQAGEAIKQLLDRTTSKDLVLVLISGGGSALLELPLPGISLTDLRTLNRLLLNSGLPIQSLNVIRSALSQIKAGGLARMAAPARVCSLILSDVIGDPLSMIASGPTVLRSDLRDQAQQLLKDTKLWSQVPKPIQQALEGQTPYRRRARRPVNHLLAGNRQLIEAAKQAAMGLGFDTKVLSRQMQGEARELGSNFGTRLRARSEGIHVPTCYLMGGETTVTVTGEGLGGRNQEFALAAADTIRGCENIVIASLASDGIDGPTDAAGAVVDGHTRRRIQEAGYQLEKSLSNNNSYPTLASAGALIKSGASSTNVADLVIGLLYT
jgi:glycerate-2-kinase